MIPFTRTIMHTLMIPFTRTIMHTLMIPSPRPTHALSCHYSQTRYNSMCYRTAPTPRHHCALHKHLHTRSRRHIPHTYCPVTIPRHDTTPCAIEPHRLHATTVPFTSICTHAPVATSHTRTVLSRLPDTIRLPVLSKPTDVTPQLCPSSVCIHSLVATPWRLFAKGSRASWQRR